MAANDETVQSGGRPLFGDAELDAALERILEGHRIDDRELEIKAAKAFVERSLLRIDGPDVYPLTESDMQTRAAGMMGINDSGISLIDDQEFVNHNLNEILSRALGLNGQAELLNADVCRSLVKFIHEPESANFPVFTKTTLNSFLKEDNKKALLEKLHAGAFNSPLSQDETTQLLTKNGIGVDGASNGVATPPLLSTDAFFKELGVLEEKAHAASRKHRLHQDLQIQAQLEINKIMDANPDWVRRTTWSKLKDRTGHGLESIIGMNPLVYPTESIFGDTLSTMDANGRVNQTMLHYKTGLGVSPRVEFRNPDVPEEAYLLAAYQVKKDGITKPHIHSGFKNPQKAMEFMRKSADALIEAGYDIDDISVDYHLRTAFDAYANEKRIETYSIGARPENVDVEPEPEPNPENQRELLPEELAIIKNEELNGPAKSLADQLNNIDNLLEIKDVKNEDLLRALQIAPALDNESTWQDLQNDVGLSPTSAVTVQKVKDHAERAIARLEKKQVDNKIDVSAKDIKLLLLATPELLSKLYGDERVKSILPLMNSEGVRVLELDQEKAKRAERSLENVNNSDPAVYDNQPQSIPGNNATVAESDNPSEGYAEMPYSDEQGDPSTMPLPGENGYDSGYDNGFPENDQYQPVDEQYQPVDEQYQPVDEQYQPVDEPSVEDVKAILDEQMANSELVSSDVASKKQEPTSKPKKTSLRDARGVSAQVLEHLGELSLGDIHAGNVDRLPSLGSFTKEQMSEQGFIFVERVSNLMNMEPGIAELIDTEELSFLQKMPAEKLSNELVLAVEHQTDRRKVASPSVAPPEQHVPTVDLEHGSGVEHGEKAIPTGPSSESLEDLLSRYSGLKLSDLSSQDIEQLPNLDQFTQQQKETEGFYLLQLATGLVNVEQEFVDLLGPDELDFVKRVPVEMLKEGVSSHPELAPPLDNSIDVASDDPTLDDSQTSRFSPSRR